MQTHDERRDFYRINDTVGLSYEQCSEFELPSKEEFANQSPDEFQLINHLSRLDLDNSSLLHSIQDDSPDIARYFKLINSKIEAIAKQIVSVGLTDEVTPTEVTLSAGGLSFVSTEQYQLGNLIKTRMILYPSNSVISSYGVVVRSVASEQGFDTAVEYRLINESDRDALVRHVLHLQSNSLRKHSIQDE